MPAIMAERGDSGEGQGAAAAAPTVKRLDNNSIYRGLAVPRKPNNSHQTRALLAAFLERSQIWRHGYDLSKETGLKSGTLYPVLMRLSE
jgi:hypothetical protein